MPLPYPPNQGPGFPRASQASRTATDPALDALRRLVPGNASPAGGMTPNANRLTEGPMSNVMDYGTASAPQMPQQAQNSDGWTSGIAAPQLGLWGAIMQAQQPPAQAPSALGLGMKAPLPQTPPVEEPFIKPSPYSAANTAIRGR